jgi:hypothetical protein
LNQLSRSPLTTGLNPFFAGNNQLNIISGGFGGQGGFANDGLPGRVRRSRTHDEAEIQGDAEENVEDVDDESIVDIQR